MWRETGESADWCRRFVLGSLDKLNAVAVRVGHGKAQAVVGAAFDLMHDQALRAQILAQRRNVIGGESNVIHAIGRLGIGRGTVSHPLLADDVSNQPASLHRIGGSQAERAGVERFHPRGVGRVERNVIDAENSRTADGGGLRVGANCKEREGKHYEESFHDAPIVA